MEAPEQAEGAKLPGSLKERVIEDCHDAPRLAEFVKKERPLTCFTKACVHVATGGRRGYRSS